MKQTIKRGTIFYVKPGRKQSNYKQLINVDHFVVLDTTTIHNKTQQIYVKAIMKKGHKTIYDTYYYSYEDPSRLWIGFDAMVIGRNSENLRNYETY